MLRKGLIFIAAFLISLLLMELFLRGAWISGESPTEFYDDIGRGRRANLDFIYHQEGFGIVQFNQYRYRGEAIAPGKETHVIKVALLGDSYVEAFQVFERHYFGELAEANLEKAFPEIRFEFMNFGRGGSDIADCYAYQKTLVEPFKPDFILYLLSEDDLYPQYSDPLRPKTVLLHDSLNVSFDFDEDILSGFQQNKALIQHSVWLNMLNNCRRQAKANSIGEILLGKAWDWFIIEDKSNEPANNLSTELHLPELSKAILKELRPDKVLIVNRSLDPMPAEFVSLCRNEGLGYLDLSPVLRKMRKQGIDPEYWAVTGATGHWNHEAHRVIGKKLAEEIALRMRDEMSEEPKKYN